jgi:DNA-binding transcriptional MerR regulator
VSGRSYLSIGDVLTLLRQEFPDVTISKIRFLESQGLVNPERTPSGYRKFYEQDVERLRWVLRQQREHFLPLKVIKGRLEQEEDIDDEDTFSGDVDIDEVGGDDEDAGFTAAPDGAASPSPTRAQEAAVAGYATPTREAAGGELRRRPVPVLVGQGTRLASSATGRSTTGAALPGFETQSTPHAPVGETEMAAATFVDPPEASPGEERPEKTASPPGPSRRAGAARPPGSRGPSKAGGAAKVTGVSAATAPEPAVPTMAGTDMTIEELVAATGLTVGDLQQLESFGLVTGRVVGGVVYYDDDALAIARTAAGFARYGVEARHLRLHKHAAEREAGFIEQIVLPLLKQRNPEARQRAHDNVTELTRLGQQLRAVLLRNALRDQLGG